MAYKGDRKFLRLMLRDIVKDDGPIVAREMNLNFTRTLTRADIVNLLPPPQECDLPPRDQHNFLRTSLMLETTDTDGQTVYVAVVLACIAEKADAYIAIRTAEHLARLTGHIARPVVASRYVSDWLYDELVESGKVFWYELTHKIFEKMEDPRDGP